MTTSPLTFSAEIGSNHCGSLERAIDHIKEASKAGATAVKFQYFRPHLLTSKQEDHPLLAKFMVPQDWLPRLYEAAEVNHVQIGYSVFHPSLVEELLPYTDFLKISAYDLTYDNLILTVATTDKPIVLSTAMATYQEIRHAVSLIETNPLTLLTGTAAYPTPTADAHVNRITNLLNHFPGPVGLSDHTTNSIAALAAVALGATYIEKHFTLIGMHESPDYIHSSSPAELVTLIRLCKSIHSALGQMTLTHYPIEDPLYHHARRTNSKPLRD